MIGVFSLWTAPNREHLLVISGMRNCVWWTIDWIQLKGKSILVSMHHCPIALGCQWLDKQKVNNPSGLYDLLASHSNVKLVVTGHVHQQYDGLWNDLPLHTSPSSCIQFKQHSQDFAISDEAPGFRWFDLGLTGTVNTGVKFLSNFDQHPDTNNAGY